LISRKASTPNPARYRRAIVLDQRVYAFDQPQKQRPPLGLLVIEGDALLVAVDVAETRVALAAVAPGARRIPFSRAFDLDDSRTHVGQDHRAERSGHVLGQVEHLQPMQRAITLGRRPDSHPSLTDLGF